MKLFDRVILSSNEDPKYLQFWPIVSRAWKQWFDCKVSLAFLTNRERNDPFVENLRQYGEVAVFKPISGIPEPNLAKVIRHILAGAYTEERVVINDIDLLPLQADYLNRYLEATPADALMTIGHELYPGAENGKFPIGYISGLGRVFKSFVNPDNLFYHDLVKNWVGLNVCDHKEDIARTVYHEDPDCFSDESLWRALIKQAGDTGYPVIGHSISPAFRTVDRANWFIDYPILRSGGYVESHLLRPYVQYEEQIQPLLNYVDEVAPYPIER